MPLASSALFALLALAQATAQITGANPAAKRPASNRPVKDGLYIAHDFRFGTGETLPELNLQLGIAEGLPRQMPHATFVLIPISDVTRGHGTHTLAAIWKDHLVDLLNQSEPGRQSGK